MCFSPKLLMDCILFLVLMPAVLAISGNESTIGNFTSNSTISSPLTTKCNATDSSRSNGTLQPAVGRIKIKWSTNKLCEGALYFSVNFSQSEMHLCYSKTYMNSHLGRELCAEWRCGNFIGFELYTNNQNGYMIHDNLTVTINNTCQKTLLTCKDIGRTELVVYKVILGLLLTLIIAVLLCRFAQPTYIALRKRFSQKRQNRWIGPTQSQSVSYHRGQASHPNNNTTKRHSYPGLERLTVNPSREPSSNRNSDYDSYGA